VQPGGWVSGDSWFSSVLSAVEMKRCFNVHLTWVIKQNTDLFPMMAIHSILKARYGERLVGHWVVFQGKISEEQLWAISYAWSHSTTSYFVSTCGSMHPADVCYETHYKNEFGTICMRSIACPQLLSWVYVYLPLIDEHNKQHQNLLALKRKWPTKNCWFRLLVTLVGMSVVDLYWIYLNHDKQKYDHMTIQEFSKKLCLEL